MSQPRFNASIYNEPGVNYININRLNNSNNNASALKIRIPPGNNYSIYNTGRSRSRKNKKAKSRKNRQYRQSRRSRR